MTTKKKYLLDVLLTITMAFLVVFLEDIQVASVIVLFWGVFVSVGFWFTRTRFSKSKHKGLEPVVPSIFVGVFCGCLFFLQDREVFYFAILSSCLWFAYWVRMREALRFLLVASAFAYLFFLPLSITLSWFEDYRFYAFLAGILLSFQSGFVVLASIKDYEFLGFNQE